MCVFAWCAALVVYQLGSAFSGAMNPVGLAAAIAILAFVCYMLFFKKYKEADKLLVK
jgi:ferrous iron transport protein B